MSLKSMRVNADLTRKQVADVLGVTTEAYRKIEILETKLTLDRGFILAKLFGVSIYDIQAATSVN